MSRELFLKLPSIKYFLEKIPSGVFFIEENLIVAEYFRQAKEYGISLKQQCEDLCVPWNSRTIPQKVLTKDLVDASALFSAHDWATFFELPERIRGVGVGFLDSLQAAHDEGNTPAQIRQNFIDFAARYGLDNHLVTEVVAT